MQNLLTKSVVTQLVRKCYAYIDLRCLKKLGVGEHPDQFLPDPIFTYYIYVLMYTDMYVNMLITSCLCLLAIRLPYQNIICNSYSVFTCYMSHPSHLWFSCTSNVMWRVQFFFKSLLILSCTQLHSFILVNHQPLSCKGNMIMSLPVVLTCTIAYVGRRADTARWPGTSVICMVYNWYKSEHTNLP